MNKETLINLVKSGKLSVAQAETFAVGLGFKGDDLLEIKKSAETPEASTSEITSADILKAINDASDKSTTAIVKAIEGIVAKLEGDMAPGGDQATDAQPPEGATMEEKVIWYLEHPDAQIPDDMMDAVATALAQKKSEEMMAQ